MDDFVKTVRQALTDQRLGPNEFMLTLLAGILRESENLERRQAENDAENQESSLTEYPVPHKSKWLRNLILPVRHQDVSSHYNAAFLAARTGQSYLIKKMVDLSKQSAEILLKQSQSNSVPLPAVTQMTSLILGYPITHVGIPDVVPETKRDEFLVEIGRWIHDILTEALIVLMAVGYSEGRTMRLLLLNQESDIEAIKNSFMTSACSPAMKARVSESQTKRELEECLTRYYGAFQYIEMTRQAYMESLVKKAVKQYGYHLPPLDASEIQGDHHMLHESIKKTAQSIHRASHIVNDPQDQDEDEILTIEESDYEQDIRSITNGKFYGYPFRTYRLTGHPGNVVSYLGTIINNAAKSLLDKSDAQMKDIKRSHRTGRRYKKAFKKGELQQLIANAGEDPNQIKRFEDLPEDIITTYTSMKSNTQKHHKVGYFTRRQLVEYLKYINNKDKLVDSGLPSETVEALQKLSDATIRNRIKTLEQEGRINFEKHAAAHYYKEEDAPNIARAVADLQKRSR